MAQHDGILDNAAGAAFRSDLNNFLLAILSNSSGATAPSTTYAYQFWADTTTGLLKQRNAANSAWITIGTLASTYLGLLNNNISVTQRLLGRNSVGAGVAEEVTLSQLLDWIGSAAQGDILYRGAASWERLAAGTSGYFLKTQGVGANPVWAVAAGNISIARNLRVYTHATVPDTRFMVSFDEAVLLDTSNNPLVIRPAGAYEVVCTTVGVGGMDAGALGVSIWYYVWAIAKADGTNAALLSASATAPTMPTGYTYKALLGVRRTTSAGILERDEQRGATVYKVRGTEDVVFSGAAGVTVWTSQALSSLVPPNATKVSLLMGLNTTGTRSIGVRGDGPHGAGSDYGECASAALDATFTGRAFKDVVLATTQTVYWIAQDTGALYRMVVLDYTLGNVNAS